MKGKKYYAVNADNGFLCSNNWDQVKRLHKYFRGDNCEGFKSKEDAIMATRQRYNENHIVHRYIGEIIMNIPRFTKDFEPSEIEELQISNYNFDVINFINQKPISMVEFY